MPRIAVTVEQPAFQAQSWGKVGWAESVVQDFFQQSHEPPASFCLELNVVPREFAELLQLEDLPAYRYFFRRRHAL